MDKSLKQLDKLELLFKAVNSDYVTQDELQAVLQVFKTVVEQIGANMEKRVGMVGDQSSASAQEMQKEYADWMRRMKAMYAACEAKIASESSILRTEMTAQIDAMRTTVEAVQAIKGDKGDTGPQGAEGKQGPAGSPDTPDQVTDKVNLGKPLIKKSRIEGLADLERISKLAAFNPTMGPSFSDLRDIKQSVTNVANTVNNLVGGKVTINYIIDGGGSALTTGVKGFVEIPYAMTITGWQLFADQVGSVVVDVYRDTYANFPPTTSIAGSELPTLVSAQSNQDLSLSTWSVGLAAGDVIAFDVKSASTLTRITVSIIGIKN